MRLDREAAVSRGDRGGFRIDEGNGDENLVKEN